MTELLIWACFFASGAMLLMLTRRRLGILELGFRSPIGVFLATHCLNVAGAAWVLSERQGHFELRSLYLATIFLATLLPIVGAWFVAEYAGMRPSDTLTYLRQAPQLRLARFRFVLIGLVTTAVCAALLLLLWREVGGLPLLAAISGNASPEDLKLLRASTYKTLPQTFTHPMNFLRLGLIPFLICGAAARSVWTGARRDSLLLVALVVVGVFYNSYASALYPVALLFVLLGLTWHYLGSLNFRQVVVSVVGFLAFPLLWGVGLLIQNRSALEAVIFELTRHGERFLYLIPDTIWSYVEFYSGARGHLMGGAQRPLALLFGQPSVNAANEVFLYRDPTAFFLGNATGPYESYFFADFGLAGVAVGGLLVGAVLQIAHLISVRGPLNELTIARFVLVCWAGYSLTLSSVFTGFLSKGLLFALVLPFVLRLFATRSGILGYGRKSRVAERDVAGVGT